MENNQLLQEIINALAMLGHALTIKITDGFGIVDRPVASLIQAVSGGGRNKGFAEHMALKLEAGMTITRRRPHGSGAPGEWLVITPEIMAAELLRHSDWEFDDCGAVLSHIPGAVRGKARIEHIGFARMRETISIPLAELFEYFPQLKPADPSPAISRTFLQPAPPKLNLTPNQIAHVRKLRSQGFRVKDLAKRFEVTMREINEVAPTKLSKADRFRKLRGEPVMELLSIPRQVPTQKREPVPEKPKISPRRQERIRRMHSDGFRPDTLARMFGASVQEIEKVVASK